MTVFTGRAGFSGSIENLYLVGRNDMHPYNKEDHSMLTVLDGLRAG